uniref:Uncharacterized protein n=1 Tax=Arundo donax TaxID=35708 RepID=A0A0A8YUT3_ARUDO
MESDHDANPCRNNATPYRGMCDPVPSDDIH